MSSPLTIPRDLLREALCSPSASLVDEIAQRLADVVAARETVSTQDASFDFERFAAAGRAELTVRPDLAPFVERLGFESLERGTRRFGSSGAFDVRWSGETITILRTTFERPGECSQRQHLIVADSRAIADAFFDAVCRFCADTRGVVWVYSGGFFSENAEMFAAIQKASFDDLVLAPHLAAALASDFRRFLASRDVYARYGAPYRRGALFLGPPGNGKTHAIRALLRDLALPTLYVRSLKAKYATEDDAIGEIFREARDRSPCVLVLEDLDALIGEETRSVFLNELDGLARNDGVIVVATTNHPERLDPALLERPSRFDRKYFFDLPAHAERVRYLERWAARLEPEVRPSPACVAELADKSASFSFAYLQELSLASIMRFIELSERGDHPRMDDVARGELAALAREVAVTASASSRVD